MPERETGYIPPEDPHKKEQEPKTSLVTANWGETGKRLEASYNEFTERSGKGTVDPNSPEGKALMTGWVLEQEPSVEMNSEASAALVWEQKQLLQSLREGDAERAQGTIQRMRELLNKVEEGIKTAS